MDICKVLDPFISPERKHRIEEIMDQRTRTVTLVLESLYDPHNHAACLRSCEALGFQDVHFITPTGGIRPNPKISQGSHQWLDIYCHNSVSDGIKALKERGYTIAAGALSPNAVSLLDLDFSKPIALAFGNEHEGLSQEFLKASDIVFQIPMVGFVQSFNVSVSVAISLFHAMTWRQRTLGHHGDMPEADKRRIRESWYHHSVEMADQILARARKEELEREEDLRK